MLHWKRSCWVLQMWQQADQSTMTLEPLQNHGWGLKEDELTITWESDKNVQNRVDSLLRGCKCSTGCLTKRCGCRRQGRDCSLGCQCISCTNTTYSRLDNEKEEVTAISLEEDMQAERLKDREGDDILDWVFGQDHETEILSSTDNDTDSDSEQEL